MTFLEQDAWLSGLLGKPAYRVAGAPKALNQFELPASSAFVEAKVDVADVDTLLHLQDLGFRVIDCNLTMERSAAEVSKIGQPIEGVRFASVADECGVRGLASDAFEQNRFHRDPQIPNAVASRIKEQWAGNYFCGKRGDWMVVAEDANGIGGFLQLLHTDNGTVVIDLIAVASRCRRRGLARAMTDFAYQCCLDRAADMRVGTQIGNSSSIALYQSMGFRVCRAAYLLHRHT
jgi:ribosomal protein S18 acetylase RimI-like enzyme